MSAVLFFIAGSGAIAGAVGVVMLRDPFYAVLALVGHLLSLAVLFLLARAEFVAAVQVVVYAGAVMVLYVFVVAYVGGREEPIGELLRGPGGRGPAAAQLRLGAAVLSGALLVELLIALLGTGLKAVSGDGAPYAPGVGGGSNQFGTPAYIGQLLLTRFLLVFEAASFLLLIAAVGAVVLARRRGGIEEDGDTERRLTPLDLIRPRGTGTMLEGVGGRAYEAARAREQNGEPGEEPVPVGAGVAPAGAPSPRGPSEQEGGW
ncbi:MAG TPA: NADH-quinone oxidoreductase subunit J [Solirubrobacteraceae bacterium]|nr:NADH-quinone oxidoreductase subunit J [Solirubrobacteraceae bacterium]